MPRLISRKNLAYPKVDGQVLSSDSKGIQSWVDNKIVGISTLGSTVGTANTIKFASGIGVTIVSGVASVSVVPANKTVTKYTATADQTTFAATYALGYVDVFFNGVKLSEDQYTSTNGTSIVLDEGAAVDDIIEIVAFTFNTGSSSGGGGSIAGIDTTGTSYFTNLNISGVTTSNSFVGNIAGTASNATLLNFEPASEYLDYNNFSNTPTIPTNNNQLTNGAGFITHQGSGTELTGIVTSIVAGTNVTISGSTGTVTINSSGGGGGGGGASRNTATLTIGSIASGITTTGNVTLPKTGVLISVHPVGTASGWLRLYTRSDLATADASRVRTVDPDPGSGVILETITSGISTVYFSPQTIFSNAEDTPINTFNYRFTKDGTAGITTFTFKYISLES